MPPKVKNTPKKPPRTLAVIRSSRARIREQIEATLNSIQDLNSAEPKFPDDQPPDAILNFVKPLLEKVQALDEEIRCHHECVEEDQENQQADCDHFELRVRRAIASLDAVCQRQQRAQANASMFYTPDRPRVRFAGEATADVIDETVSMPRQTNQVLSQPIVIRNSKDFDAAQKPEVFRGDRLKFRTFMKQFEIFISKNPQASDCERLIALRKFVSDEPKQLVDALDLTEANYQIALSILEQNYSRVDVDRERLLAELRNLPRVAEMSDIVALRSLVIKVQTNTRVLESLGVKPEFLAVMVESSINASIPPELRQLFKQWQRMELSLNVRPTAAEPAQTLSSSTPARPIFPTSFATPAHRLFDITTEAVESKPSQEQIQDPVLRLQTTIRHILQHIQDYEDSGYLEKALSASSNKTDQPSRRAASNRKVTATVTAVASRKRQSNDSGSRPVRPCLFCKTSDHNSSRCAASLSLEKRHEILGKQKRCASCFRSQHAKPEDCRGPRVPCSVCKSPEPEPVTESSLLYECDHLEFQIESCRRSRKSHCDCTLAPFP